MVPTVSPLLENDVVMADRRLVGCCPRRSDVLSAVSLAPGKAQVRRPLLVALARGLFAAIDVLRAQGIPELAEKHEDRSAHGDEESPATAHHEPQEREQTGQGHKGEEIVVESRLFWDQALFVNKAREPAEDDQDQPSDPRCPPGNLD
jgi:hypothetical protein